MKIALVRIVPGNKRDMPGQGGTITTKDGDYSIMVIPMADDKIVEALSMSADGAYEIIQVQKKVQNLREE